MANFLFQDKSLLIFGVSTLSMYLFLKGLYRVFETGKQGVLKLIIYPIKSVPGIEVDHLEITATGVTYAGVHDRALMLLNEHKNLVSLRTKPTLACISTSFEDGGDTICLTAPLMPPLRISTRCDKDLAANELVKFNIWGQEISGVEYSKEASAWFTLYLKSETTLVKFLPDSMTFRKTDLHTEKEELVHDAEQPIVYQDECAVALNNQASLDDLNKKLAAKGRPLVSYRNFRSNILVRVGDDPQNSGPFAEDAWRRIQVGPKVQLKLAKPCHRCTTTTTDPDTGRKTADFEPLETLKEYRVKEEWKHLYSTSPIFGLSLSPEVLGTVRLGDHVTILS